MHQKQCFVPERFSRFDLICSMPHLPPKYCSQRLGPSEMKNSTTRIKKQPTSRSANASGKFVILTRAQILGESSQLAKNFPSDQQSGCRKSLHNTRCLTGLTGPGAFQPGRRILRKTRSTDRPHVRIVAKCVHTVSKPIRFGDTVSVEKGNEFTMRPLGPSIANRSDIASSNMNDIMPHPSCLGRRVISGGIVNDQHRIVVRRVIQCVQAGEATLNVFAFVVSRYDHIDMRPVATWSRLRY